MENPFKQIIEHHEVPDMLREKVMNDVRLIKLSLDMADLVAIKYPSSIVDLLGARSSKKKRKN